MSGAGDCTKTSAWGSNWDWTKDWSVDWGKDFDKEWKDNKNDADSMRERVETLEDAIRKASNCSADEQQQQQQQLAVGANQVSDGSVATTTDSSRAGSNCSLAIGVNGTELAAAGAAAPAGGGAAALPIGGRKLAGRVPVDLLPGSSSSSAASPVAAAWLAAESAATCSRSATELLLRPLQYLSMKASTASAAAAVEAAVAAEFADSLWEQHEENLQEGVDEDDSEFFLEDGEDHSEDTGWAWSDPEDEQDGEGEGGADDAAAAAGAVGASRRLSQVSLPGFINFDVGCWYCYYGKGESPVEGDVEGERTWALTATLSPLTAPYCGKGEGCCEVGGKYGKLTAAAAQLSGVDRRMMHPAVAVLQRPQNQLLLAAAKLRPAGFYYSSTWFYKYW